MNTNETMAEVFKEIIVWLGRGVDLHNRLQLVMEKEREKIRETLTSDFSLPPNIQTTSINVSRRSTSDPRPAHYVPENPSVTSRINYPRRFVQSFLPASSLPFVSEVHLPSSTLAPLTSASETPTGAIIKRP